MIKERDDTQITQLSQAHLKIKAQLTIQATREKDFQDQLQQLQSKNDSYKLEYDRNTNERDQVRLAENTKLRFQVEALLTVESAREKKFND